MISGSLWLMINGVIALAVSIVGLLRPGYALFVYGLSLGLPANAIPLEGFGGRLKLDDILAVVLLAISFGTPGQRRLPPLPQPFKMLAIAFFSYSLLSLTFASTKGLAIDPYRMVKFFGSTIVLVALTRLLRRPDNLRYFAMGATLGAVVLISYSGIAFMELAGQRFDRFYDWRVAVTPTQYISSTGIALYGVVYALAAIIAWHSEKRRYLRQFLWGPAAVLLSLAPMLVLSRASSFGIVAGMGVATYLLRSYRLRASLLVASFMAVIALAALNPSMTAAYNLFADPGKQPGLTGRIHIIQAGLRAIGRSPLFGHGLARGRETIAKEMGRTKHKAVHNTYLAVFINLGVIGSLIYGLLLYALLKGTLWLVKLPQWHTLGVFAMAYLVALLVTDMAHSTSWWNKVPFHLVAMIIALQAMAGIRNTTGRLRVRVAGDPAHDPDASHHEAGVPT